MPKLLPRINILLPQNVYDDFAARCADAGVSMSTVIRAIIVQEMEKPAMTAANRKAARQHELEMAAIRRGEAEKRREEIVKSADKHTITQLAARYGMSVSGVSRLLSRARNQASM